MGSVSNHQRRENAGAGHCAVCDVDLTPTANGSDGSICLLCRAAILNQMFQIRRQEAAVAQNSKDDRRNHRLFPTLLPAS